MYLINNEIQYFAAFYPPGAREARCRLVLRLLCGFRVCWCNYIIYYLCERVRIRTYHVRNNYVTYTAPCVSRLRKFSRLLCVAAMCSLPQLRL